MIISSDPLGKEIFEYLKTKLDIPENVISLSLSLGIDEALMIECKFYPNARLTTEQALKAYLRDKY